MKQSRTFRVGEGRQLSFAVTSVARRERIIEYERTRKRDLRANPGNSGQKKASLHNLRECRRIVDKRGQNRSESENRPATHQRQMGAGRRRRKLKKCGNADKSGRNAGGPHAGV
jgi:hypothetical protein